ncbi:gastrula zinc finger protein XlCGF57.1-like [Chrysoperla carnea]|uniref:gastrula zinc finger protein XlCGF57.1-like n=1 Tax=Chrysoperla carnea TaxID=189513 RepID=UPI001D06E73C|nr:gastrula zinc finger protein XlCGF57.1-like [Chrysoperla carnea]
MLEAMETCIMSDFENVCRICMKFDETFLSITTFKIIDMIIACASVQIWENDDLPNQICHACFLQLQNTINFKQLCENSDHAFRQIIEQNKINNENDFANVKDEEFEDYAHDYSLIDIKEEEIDRIGEESKKSEQDNVLEIKNIEKPQSNKMQIGTKSEEESDTCEDIKGDDNVTKTFICEKCNKEFKRLWVLGQHMQRKHRAKPLKCSECKLKCYHPLHLKQHQEVAHNPLNHTCSTCNKVFTNIYNLKYHKCKHLSPKLHCRRCDKSFQDKRELKCHNKEKHAMEMYVACHICGKSITKKSLNNHLATHEERDKRTCIVCSKTFIREDTLARHIKLIHEDKIRERNFLCNICGHASRFAADLRKHLRTHSTERPFACKHCDKTYRSEDNLKEHISCAHLDERKFQCRFCPQAFNHKKTLVHHERRHTGEKPHKCEVCGKRFIQKIALQIHSKTHINSSENFMRNSI